LDNKGSRVATRVRKGWLIGGGLIAVFALVLALAWRDAGREPLRLIAVPVNLPDTTR
jgi:hypothetical protein